MGFISSTQIGTLIYETIQKELYSYQEIVTQALKECAVTQEDKDLITKDLINATNQQVSSQDRLINYFAYEAEHTPQIIKKYIVLANQSGSIATDLNYQQ